MTELRQHEIENLRRSVAMAAPMQPGLSREVALTVLAQLKETTAERDRLRSELVALGYA